MCTLHTPASPSELIYKLFILSLSHICLLPLLLLAPTPLSSPLPPPLLSLTFSASISSYSSFSLFPSLPSPPPSYFITQGRWVRYLTSTGRPPSELTTIPSPQQLADGWLITPWNVYCRQAPYSITVFFRAELNYFSHHSRTTLVGFSVSLFFPFHCYPQLPSSYISLLTLLF